MADKIKIVSTHIENDVKNNAPTLVYTDEHGVEWVVNQDGGQWIKLIKKEDSWYFKNI